MKKYILELTVFLTGAMVMILELVGSHIFAPYVGTSTIVWTSLIGIILASLSLGYWLGGKAADRRSQLGVLAGILVIAAIFVVLTAFLNQTILEVLVATVPDVRVNTLLAGLLLFVPATLFLGMVSPYAVRLKIQAVETSGSTVGRLSALSTLGSIVGTFLTGFVLFGYFSSVEILLSVAVVLIILSLLIWISKWQPRILLLILVLISFSAHQEIVAAQVSVGFIDQDTPYNRVWIYPAYLNDEQRLVRMMTINREASSAIDLNSDELVFKYTRFYNLDAHFRPNLQKALMLGGAGYSYPKEFLTRFPQAEIDVVEIDPALTELARQYFRLVDDPRMKIHHEDGRTFLNRSKEKYDVIYGDAFKSLYAIPFQLATEEAVQKMYDNLADGGVVLANLIGTVEGIRGQFVRAEYATFKAVFPQVYLFPVESSTDGSAIQNIMLVAVKSEEKASFLSQNPELQDYLDMLWTKPIAEDKPVLTDDFAPVDRYTTDLILSL